MSNPGIERIGTYLPAQRLSLAELGEKFDAKPDFVKRKIGFTELARKDETEECSDLCVKAFEQIADSLSFSFDELDCLVVVTQNPDSGAIPHAAALVHQKLNAPASASCFDISLGCTGYVHGLSILKGFMRENAFQHGLLFTCDPYSTIIDPDDRDTAMLFGDAATCTVLSPKSAYQLGKTDFATESKSAHAIQTDCWGGHLAMDGNLVFRSVSLTVPGLIKQNLARNETSLEELDLCLVHQGSKFIVDTVRSLLRQPEEKVPFLAGPYGNTVSSSIPLMLKDVLQQAPLPQRILLTGFGVGLSAASTVITRTDTI
ncbi:MAG: ketoacyl-ACP synthase III [Planctomycetaceae bacterium]|nr:ketoacyl-ACP synthase III [Planctomycetaceae bacterium]